VIDALVEMMDVEDNCDAEEEDGDTDIQFREFVRVFGCDDLTALPQLHSSAGGAGNKASYDLTPRQKAALRPGVRALELRRAHTIIKEKLLTKFKTLGSAFRFIDNDHTGAVERAEIEEALSHLNLGMLKPAVVLNLIDFIDVDGGDISFSEFANVFTADDIMAIAPDTPASTRMRTAAPASTSRYPPVSEQELTEAFQTIHECLTKRGNADADRVRRLMRRSDEAKGYVSKKVSVADAMGVLSTLGLKGMRKPLLAAVVQRFIDKPSAPIVDDKKETVLYDAMCDCMTEGCLPPLP